MPVSRKLLHNESVGFDLTDLEAKVLRDLSSGLSERETYLQMGISESELDGIWQQVSIKMQSVTPSTIDEYELKLLYNRVERRRLASELWASEARLGALMDTAPEAIMIIEGRSGRIVRVNSQTSIMFGYSPRE